MTPRHSVEMVASDIIVEAIASGGTKEPGEELIERCAARVQQAIDSATKPLREEIESMTREIIAANNLLAVLHRDGGQHTDEVGFIQSCKDGERVWCGLVTEVEKLREETLLLVGQSPLSRHEECREAIKPLVEAQAQALYALTEAERVIRAWTTTTTGMGANIVQEDRSRSALALREIEKARAVLAAYEESKK